MLLQTSDKVFDLDHLHLAAKTAAATNKPRYYSTHLQYQHRHFDADCQLLKRSKEQLSQGAGTAQSSVFTWRTSSMLMSCSPPFSGLYTSVPLMITVCAGRLTPHARVAVQTRTFFRSSICIADSGKGSADSIQGKPTKNFQQSVCDVKRQFSPLLVDALS